MATHRLTTSQKFRVRSFDQPFSSYRHVDTTYGDISAIRRLFSLARSGKAHTLMIERIRPTGLIADENEEIKSYYDDYELKGLEKISFWK